MRFDDRKILVTGASGGIGRQIVQRFRTAGAQVAVADLDVAALEARTVSKVWTTSAEPPETV